MLAPVLGAIHGMAHSHHYCPEHHAFEESGARDAASPPPPATSTTDPARAVADLDEWAATEAAGGGHEECAFSQLFCRDGWAASERTWSPIGILEHRDAPVLESTEVRPIPLLASAPKSSPPAC